MVYLMSSRVKLSVHRYNPFPLQTIITQCPFPEGQHVKQRQNNWKLHKGVHGGIMMPPQTDVREALKGNARTWQCIGIPAPYRNSQEGCASHGLLTEELLLRDDQLGSGETWEQSAVSSSKLDLLKAHRSTKVGRHWLWTCCGLTGFYKVFCISHSQWFSCISSTHSTSDSSVFCWRSAPQSNQTSFPVHCRHSVLFYTKE